MLADLRNHLFRHLQRLSLGFYERNRAGALVSRITNDVEALDQLVTDGVTSLVQNTLTLLGTAVIMFILDWRLGLATLTVVPALVVGTTIFRNKSSRSYRRVRERLSNVTATLAEDIAGMRVLQAFTRERAARENFSEINRQYRAVNHETVVQNALYFPFVDLLSTISTAVVLGYGGYLVFEGDMTIGVLTAFLGYLTNFFDPVQQLSQLYSTFLSAVAALDKIQDVLAQESEVTDADDAADLESVQRPRPLRRRPLQVRDRARRCCTASSSTSRRARPSRSSATPAPASRRSRSCSRASTTRPTARSRSTAPTCATVRQESLRRQLGIVPQEGFLFAGSVADNIAFGRPDATREEIEAAARTVGADEFIGRLEDGYDTQLGERGFRLSLGQRQLVAFSRALLADPRILILDEATSSVDIGTERRIERALRRLLHGRTAFIIAHRLSTIRDADLIVVLEHGTIVEQGTHDELLRARGRYAELYGTWAEDAA